MKESGKKLKKLRGRLMNFRKSLKRINGSNMKKQSRGSKIKRQSVESNLRMPTIESRKSSSRSHYIKSMKRGLSNRLNCHSLSRRRSSSKKSEISTSQLINLQ